MARIPKWIWWILAAIVGMFLLVGIAVPILVSSSVVKDRIESEFAKNTNGTLSLKSARLSGWGGLKIQLDGVQITDAKKRDALTAKTAKVSVPFWAVFGMGSAVKVIVQDPKVVFVQNGSRSNWQDLLEKKSVRSPSPAPPPHASSKAAPPAPASSSQSAGSSSQPFWLAPLFAAKVNVSLENADIAYIADGEKTDLVRVYANLKGVGMNSDIKLVVTGGLKRKGKEDTSDGTFKIGGHLTTSMGAPQRFDLDVDLTGVTLAYGSQFKKSNGVPLDFKAAGKFSKAGEVQTIDYEKLAFELGKNTVVASGKTTLGSKMRTEVVAKNQKILLTGLGAMVPSMQAMDGVLEMDSLRFVSAGEAVSLMSSGKIPDASFHLEGKPKPLPVTAGTYSLKHQTKTDVDVSLGVFGGRTQVKATLTPTGKTSTGNFEYNIQKLSVDKATEIFMKDFAQTFSGDVASSGSGKVKIGEGLDPLKSTSLSGKFSVAPATVRTIDVGKVALESQKSLGKILSALKAGDKAQQKLADAESEYESIRGTFTVKGGVFASKDLFAKALPQKGIDLKGSTTVNLISKKINAEWLVEDPYDKLGLLKQLSGIKQKALSDLLKNESGVVSFPLTAGCLFDKPCFSLKKAEKFFKSRLTGNLKKNIKKEASGMIKDLIKGDKKDLKNKAKDLLKGLGF